MITPNTSPTLTPAIVKAYREARGKDGMPLSKRAFAAELNTITEPCRQTISIQTITRWERGDNLPKPIWMQALLLLAPANTWQAKFAQDLRAARYPGLYQPAGRIGKRILTGSPD